ncbi:DUF397 domain-containing protein [Streptomyces sp. NPDC029674]|uniref:DUF397 domain-containing protein n=1 Tax=Streptomyces sp. NPDC029674 TaxID=3365297 RepID=UPI00384A8E93
MSATAWQKSSFSGSGDGNNCVEPTAADPHVRLRESDAPAVELSAGAKALAQFMHAIKASGQ